MKKSIVHKRRRGWEFRDDKRRGSIRDWMDPLMITAWQDRDFPLPRRLNLLVQQSRGANPSPPPIVI
ncbi:hypothetical protein J1614_012140 [Plenodomus biglobosus]|nr:hypothetical protein J1614_012140 [Plenodomus biglobosus]